MTTPVSSVGVHGKKICPDVNESATVIYASYADRVLGVTKELWFGNVGNLKRTTNESKSWRNRLGLSG